MQIDPLRVIDLLAADDELVVLHGYAEVGHREPGHGEGDPQSVFAELLDIVGGYPSAETLLTRSSARSKWSKPKSKGELNSDSRDMHPSPLCRARAHDPPVCGTRSHTVH